jgi:hypothetical protein
MTFPIGGNDGNFNIGRAIQRGAEEHIRRAVDPLGLFGGDSFGARGASGLFPKGAGGAGGIEEILASLSKKDKNSQFDTSNAGDGLFSGGKDFGQAVQGIMGGIGQALQGVMGLVKNLLGGLLGGGGGGGIMSMLGGL